MATPQRPKVLLFDIGGVCIRSPFQSILDYELTLGIPPGWINYSISQTAPNGFWHQLERGEIAMDADYFAGFNRDLHDVGRWQTFYKREQMKNLKLAKEVPPLPKINGEWLFNEMMSASAYPDPWMFPALKNLKKSGQYILAALSNTVIFPPGHKFYQEDYFDDPVRSLFDVFMSSAHIGIRKPDPKMYEYALDKVNSFAKSNSSSSRGQRLDWASGVRPDEIVFLDDIGENLKEARKQGFRTIRVPLGRTYEAVDELEKAAGLKVAGDHPKVPIRPRLTLDKAKI